jgi:ornithine carbamoyltransferase
MACNLRNRSVLKLLDFSPEEIKFLLDLSAHLKWAHYNGTEQPRMTGKKIILVFEKSSTRTRCAFEAAAYDQGARVTYLDPSASQLGKKESMKDTARVLGRMYDGIGYRGFGQEVVELLAEYSKVTVWNGLTNEFHPTQVLADILTIIEHTDKPLSQVKLAYLGDARFNMGNSLLIWYSKDGNGFSLRYSKEHAAGAGTCAKGEGNRQRDRSQDKYNGQHGRGGKRLRFSLYGCLGVHG